MSITITKEVEVDVDIDVQEHLQDLSRSEMLELARGLATRGVTYGAAGADEDQQWQILRSAVKEGDLEKALTKLESIAWTFHDVLLDTSRLRTAVRT